MFHFKKVGAQHPKSSIIITPKSVVAIFYAVAAASFFVSSTAQAANATWLGTTSGSWGVPTNWNGGVPGGVGTTTNTDIVTFNSNPSNKTVTLDKSYNIGGITFDTASVGAYTIGSTSGSSLIMSANSTIQMTANVAATETINAPLLLEGNLSIANNASSTSAGLKIGGAISADTGVSGTLTFSGTNQSSLNTVSGVIANGSGTMAVAVNAGKWVLSGNNTYTGGLTISGAPTIVTISGSNANTGGTILNGATVYVSNNYAFGNATRSLTVQGSGTSFLNVNSANVTIASSIDLSSGLLGSNDNSGFTLSLTGTLSGAGGVYKMGPGALSLSAANTYSGNTTLTDGILALGNDQALGSGTLVYAPGSNKTPVLQSNDSTARSIANALSLSGASKLFTFGAAGTGDLNFTNTGNTALTSSGTFQIINNVSFAAIFSSTNSLAKSGSGTMILAGANTYSGVTNVNAGTLQVGNGTSGSIVSGTVSVAAGATLAFDQANNTGYTGTITNAGTVKGMASGTNTLSGAISGTGGFVQSGTGTTILTGSSTYTGATSVTGGKLVIGSLGSLGNTAVTVGAAGSLNVNGLIAGGVTSDGYVSGVGTIGGSLLITSGTLAPGDGGIGTLTTNGGLTVQSGAKISMQLNSLSSYDKIVVSGATSLAGTLDLTLGNELAIGNVFTLIDANSAITGAFSTITIGGAHVTITGTTATTTDFIYEGTSYKLNSAGGNHDLTLSVIAVPEPETWAMMITGMGCLIGLQRLRRQAA